MQQEQEQYILGNEIIENLRNYQKANTLKKEALKVIVKQLQHNEIQDLKKAFQYLDTDCSGYLNYEKLSIEKDNKESEKIKYSEFIAASMSSNLYLTKEKLQVAFRYFDIDNSGYITEQDLIEAFRRLGKTLTNEQIQKIMKESDLLNDGRISFNEFLTIMMPDGVQSGMLYHYNSTSEVIEIKSALPQAKK